MDIDITMACDVSIKCVFFSTKTMGIMKINLGIVRENTTLVLNYPVNFVPGSADRPAAALRCACLLICRYYIVHHVANI